VRAVAARIRCDEPGQHGEEDDAEEGAREHEPVLLRALRLHGLVHVAIVELQSRARPAVTRV